MGGWHHKLNEHEHEFKQTSGGSEGQCGAVNGVAKIQTGLTEQQQKKLITL